MVTTHPARLTTKAIIETLEPSGIPIGKGVAPAAGGWQGTPGQPPFKGYAVVHPVGGSMDGPIGDWVADAQARYQITAVGLTQDQCEWVADACCAHLMNASIAVAGRKVQLVTIDDLGGVYRDDTVQHPVFFNPRMYRLLTTSA